MIGVGVRAAIPNAAAVDEGAHAVGGAAAPGQGQVGDGSPVGGARRGVVGAGGNAAIPSSVVVDHVVNRVGRIAAPGPGNRGLGPVVQVRRLVAGGARMGRDAAVPDAAVADQVVHPVVLGRDPGGGQGGGVVIIDAHLEGGREADVSVFAARKGNRARGPVVGRVEGPARPVAAIEGQQGPLEPHFGQLAAHAGRIGAVAQDHRLVADGQIAGEPDAQHGDEAQGHQRDRAPAALKVGVHQGSRVWLRMNRRGEALL